MPDRIRIIDGKKGLHELRPSVDQLSFMGEHSRKLIDLLDVEIERTYAAAPKRVQGYKLDRGEKRNPVPQQRERLLEKAIWKRWRHDHLPEGATPFYPHLCHHIQTFQMPLQGQRTDRSWGKIDLVGVTNHGLPIVLELKREKAKDTPLRMLVEGLAYAVALRRAWNEGFLRQEWKKVVTKLSKDWEAPKTLRTVPVFGIAPIEYWNRKFGERGKRTDDKVPEDAWEPFNRLCEACSQRGFPVSFFSFESSGDDETGLPKIENVALCEFIGPRPAMNHQG